MDSPKSRRLENRKLRYSLLQPGNLLQIGLEIVKRHGMKAISGRPISDFEDVVVTLGDPLGLGSYFGNQTRITLSTVEGLSMAYVALYYERQAKPGTKHLIAVDIEDRLKGQTERELYLSDGVLAKYTKEFPELDTITPFQQVMAQNILGKNKQQNIEDEIIKQVRAKIARRSDYNNVSGLIISAIPAGGEIDIEKICNACDMEAFVPTFLILYKNNLDRCVVMHLGNDIKSMDDLQKRAVDIAPKFTRSGK